MIIPELISWYTSSAVPIGSAQAALHSVTLNEIASPMSSLPAPRPRRQLTFSESVPRRFVAGARCMISGSQLESLLRLQLHTEAIPIGFRNRLCNAAFDHRRKRSRGFNEDREQPPEEPLTHTRSAWWFHRPSSSFSVRFPSAPSAYVRHVQAPPYIYTDTTSPLPRVPQVCS